MIAHRPSPGKNLDKAIKVRAQNQRGPAELTRDDMPVADPRIESRSPDADQIGRLVDAICQPYPYPIVAGSTVPPRLTLSLVISLQHEGALAGSHAEPFCA